MCSTLSSGSSQVQVPLSRRNRGRRETPHRVDNPFPNRAPPRTIHIALRPPRDHPDLSTLPPPLLGLSSTLRSAVEARCGCRQDRTWNHSPPSTAPISTRYPCEPASPDSTPRSRRYRRLSRPHVQLRSHDPLRLAPKNDIAAFLCLCR